MRLVRFFLAVLALAPAALVAGCTKATVIGTPCMADGDCNVAGQVCAPGLGGGASICTRKCTGQTGPEGCPVGYDCFPTDPAKGSTCNRVRYEFDATTGAPLLFGRDCALDYLACANAGSANANPVCRKIFDFSGDPPTPVEIDPNAYCTGACETDADCPLDFLCDVDVDGARLCLRRDQCAPCTVDANCPTSNPLCVPTRDGTARYCTKSCAFRSDCGGVQNTALTCAETTNAAGTPLLACLHRFGACKGEGNMCDPCRTDADCEKTQSTCITNSATGERFCSKRCTSDAACSGAAGTVATACDNTDFYDPNLNPGGRSLGLCNGDVEHVEPGLFSCWMPE
jgi:hypothetical protein